MRDCWLGSWRAGVRPLAVSERVDEVFIYNKLSRVHPSDLQYHFPFPCEFRAITQEARAE